MITGDFRFIKFMNVGTSRFSFWIIFQDLRWDNQGKRGRREIVNFFTNLIGPLGKSWQYEKNDHSFTIKIDEEIHATMLLLKYCMK